MRHGVAERRRLTERLRQRLGQGPGCAGAAAPDRIGHRWVSGSPPLLTAPLLAAAVAAAPAGAAPAAGRTSQHIGRYGAQRLPSNEVSFTLVRGKVGGFSIPWAARCDDTDLKGAQPALLDRILIGDALPLRDGKFAASGTYVFPPGRGQSAAVTFTLRGVVHGGRASGTFSVIASLTIANRGLAGECKTRPTIRWHAVVGRRPRSTAAPARARPHTAFTGVIAYARSDDGGANSSLFAIVPGGVQRPVALTHPPAGASDSAPAMPPHPIPMTYQRTSGGTSQLFVTDPEGFGLTYSTPLGEGRITDFAQGASDPTVLSNIVVFSVGQGADCSLWASSQYGEHPLQLTDHGGAPGCDDAPAWSADGNRLLFRRTATDAAGAPVSARWLILDMVGGTPRPVDFGAVTPSAVAWGPGPRLAYLVPGALRVMNPDGTGRRTVLSSPGLTGRPAWSPVGDHIAIATRRADGSTDLISVPVGGGKPSDITDTPGQSESDPAWVFGPTRAGGGEPGPSIHVKSQSVRPHGRRRKGSRS